ncbi:hypothetical protein OUZ56_014163 [Daphnia magna]|uniref:Uncharacterized protein n=1 Tax=Daphnia magna TaxID=35525 RepID=A0ABQ9Z804_9CRUS|nr:hypothetical protein OUZ56_014163 [Daphnia magna]
MYCDFTSGQIVCVKDQHGQARANTTKLLKTKKPERTTTAMIPQGGAMLEVRNDGIGRNRSDTSGFFAPLSCESFGGDAQGGNAMTDETPAAVVAPRDPSFFLVMFVVRGKEKKRIKISHHGQLNERNLLKRLPDDGGVLRRRRPSESRTLGLQLQKL